VIAMSQALGVDTVVFEENGRWVVDLVVIMDDGVVRRRIDSYHTERLARIHARYIKRGAERDIGGGPVNG
jgi:hypothetical protein